MYAPKTVHMDLIWGLGVWMYILSRIIEAHIFAYFFLLVNTKNNVISERLYSPEDSVLVDE